MRYLIKDKLAAVVILYNHDPQEIFQNILTYSKYLNKLYIYDNSSKKQDELFILLNQLGDNIEFVYDGKNEGIAKRLNTAALKAIEDGFDFLLTMDQDSSFLSFSFQQYLDEISECEISDVGQFGVNFQPQFTLFKSYPEQVNSLITSGSIICLEHFNLIGNFNENLFIDFVDVDFSYRVNYAGFKNILFTNVTLQHQVGELVTARSFKNFKLSKRIIHPPIRVYYIVRNSLYLFFRANNLSFKKRIAIFKNVKILKNSLIYHPNLSKVYFYIFVGIFDFLRNKMGKK